MRLNRACVIPVRGCVCGVVGCVWTGLTAGRAVIKVWVSRSALGCATVDGESPVDENFMFCLAHFPE